MSIQANKKTTEPDISSGQVADYLEKHLDFFKDHEDLLSKLYIPHNTNGATSLIERQVALLREKNGKLKNRLRELVAVAKANERLSGNLKQLAVLLLEAETLPEVIFTVLDALRTELNSDFAVIRLLSNDQAAVDEYSEWFVHRDTEELKLFRDLFDGKRPICGRLSEPRVKFLFGNNAEHIGSAALVPLISGIDLGVLAIGGREASRFHPGMGTLFLQQLGELVSAALKPHMHQS